MKIGKKQIDFTQGNIVHSIIAFSLPIVAGELLQNLYAYSEAGNLREIVERFAHWERHYPKRILADRIYQNRENLNFWKEYGIRLSSPALSRPKKDASPLVH